MAEFLFYYFFFATYQSDGYMLLLFLWIMSVNS